MIAKRPAALADMRSHDEIRQAVTVVIADPNKDRSEALSIDEVAREPTGFLADRVGCSYGAIAVKKQHKHQAHVRTAAIAARKPDGQIRIAVTVKVTERHDGTAESIAIADVHAEVEAGTSDQRSRNRGSEGRTEKGNP